MAGDSAADDPTFLLEHLATFTVARDNATATGVVYPEDGMRRLLQLEKTTGIWSQKMEIALTKNRQVLILDYDTKSVIEKFPVTWIESPTPFTNTDPMELYNNILIFIVAPPPGIANHNYPEMHIFHCQNIDANILCNYLVNLKRGGDEVDYDHRSREKEHHHRASSSKNDQHHGDGSTAMVRNKFHRSDSMGDEGGHLPKSMFNATINSDKYERDVQVLNYCFDDIEKFIARLQHSAAASRELERRRRHKKYKNGYQDPGEGLLSLRTRPPSESEFIDIFAKFKLSFNLLAKLRSHIHDPNAPELVHFLFTPLALIVDASHDIIPMSGHNDGSPKSFNLPSQVVAPLLTTEAINLLVNCVTSKETELWRSLGDAWQLPRSKFCIKYNNLGDINYHPTFYDGWSPEFPLNFDEILADAVSPASSGGSKLDVRSPKEKDSPTNFRNMYQQQSPHTAARHHHHHHSGEMEDSLSIDSIEHRGHPSSSSATAAVASASAHQQQHHHSGPASHGAPIAADDKDIGGWIQEMQQRRAKVVIVTYPRTANNEKELTVQRGEILEILDDTRKWWKAKNILGQVAHVPHTIVSPYGQRQGSQEKMGGGNVVGGAANNGQDVFQNPLYSKK